MVVMTREVKRGYLWLFLFVIGLVIGTLFANYGFDLASLQKSFLENYQVNIINKEILWSDLFVHILISRAAVFLLLGVLIYFFKSNMILYLTTVYLGFAFGVIISLLTVSYGVKSYLVLLGMMFPQFFVYIALYILMIKIADYQKSFETEVFFKEKRIGYQKIILIVIIALVIGSFLESYINPVFLKYIINLI